MNIRTNNNPRYKLITCCECGREILSVLKDKCRDCHEAKLYGRMSLFQKLKARNYIENGVGIITDSKGKTHEVTLEEFELVKMYLWHNVSGCAQYKGKCLYPFLGRTQKKREKQIKVVIDSRPKREWNYAFRIVDGKRISEMTIYKATSPSGKVYIGKTVGTLNKRISSHKRNAEKFSKGGKFMSALRKYGVDKFQWSVLENTNDYDTLNALECWYIQHYDSINKGYNTCVGGDLGTLGMPCSDETKAKLRAANIGRTSNYKRTYERYCQIHDERNWPWFAAYDVKGNLISVKRKAEELTEIVKLDRASIYNSLAGKYKSSCGFTFKKLYKEDIKQLNITI